MCDTLAIVQARRTLFAKNSDRDGNEAQIIEWHPRRNYPAGAELRCTGLTIPQAARTNAILISRPFWMWGAEMGANEHGVVIGNEAVFTTQPLAKEGLLGMDLLRLALERADNAREACDVITRLLLAHGQGGGCGHENRGFSYHNSFLIVDRREGYLIETAGRYWAVEPVRGPRSISNGLTIPQFRKEHARRLHGAVAACELRRARTGRLAREAANAGDLMAILRDYGGRTVPRYNWMNGGMTAPCMHAGGLIAASQTTASWVSDLSAEGARHWITGTSIPSLSLFKPVSVGAPLDLGPAPSDHVDADSLWWKHERFARRALRDPQRWLPLFASERDAIERAWLASPPPSAEAFRLHHELLDRWNARLDAETIPDHRPWYVRRYWAKRDRLAGLA
jgi:hypothetical protein